MDQGSDAAAGLARGVNQNAAFGAAINLDASEHRRHGASSDRQDVDATSIALEDAVGDRERARAIRFKEEADSSGEAAARVAPDDAVANAQRPAAVEDYSVSARPALSVDGDPAQADRVTGAGVDGDSGPTHPRDHARNADTVVDDADRLGDREGAVGAWIEDVDLAPFRGPIVSALKGA